MQGTEDTNFSVERSICENVLCTKAEATGGEGFKDYLSKIEKKQLKLQVWEPVKQKTEM